MKKKKSIILIVIILLTISVIFATVVMKKQKNDEESLIDFASTTVEQRQVWNSFLSSNQYLSQIKTIPYIAEIDLIKLAITSENIETERIVTEEIEKKPSLSMGDGYKKSKNNINEYLKSLLGQEEVAYNFVETYVKQDNYLIIGEEYVYYTKIEVPEKIYIAVTYEIENNNYEAQIYEYDVTETNKEALIKMLETGEINREIEINSKYFLTGQISNNNIRINTKQEYK